MTIAKNKAAAGFTLVEVLIGSTMAAVIMLAVLSSYLFLGRNLSRLANLQTLEVQSRRTLMYFAQDVRMTSSITTAADNTAVLNLPSISGPITVTYVYDPIVAHTLTRTTSTGSTQILLTNLESFDFNYYNSAGTSITDILSIKQAAMTFSSQIGSSANGTQTPLNQVASARIIMRNKYTVLP